MEFTHEQVKEILNRIEDRLFDMRKKKGEFYQECGITSAAYSFWNTGKHSPTTKMLAKIADYLDVSYNWLVYGEEKNQDAKSNLEDDGIDFRQQLKDNQDFKILFNAALNAPRSALYEATAVLLKSKEGK